MIAVDDQIVAGVCFRAVTWSAGAAGQTQGAHHIASGHVAQGHDHPQAGQGGQPRGQEGPAGRLLGRQRAVAGWGAAHRIGDHAVDQDEAVVGPRAIGAAGKAGVDQGLVEKDAGVIAGERPAGPVGSRSPRRQSHHQKARGRIAEGGGGAVEPVGVLEAVLRAVVGQTRAERTVPRRLGRRDAFSPPVRPLSRHRDRPARAGAPRGRGRDPPAGSGAGDRGRAGR